MNTFRFFVLGILSSVLLAGCRSVDQMKVVFKNPSRFDRIGEVVEVPVDSVLKVIGGRYCYVTDNLGNEVPSQITYDSKLIFSVSVKSESSAIYYINSSATMHVYETLVSGRLYPERADDVAWENELVGFRVYGPATQAKGEKSYGYDIFFKYPDNGLVLEKLYEPETDPATWIKHDSLAAIDPGLAEDFVKSFSYHRDHGLGMDCYAVGSTLGAGVAALIDNDSISFPWCYSKAEVLDNGPLRFTVALDFEPRPVGNDTVTEHRVISLDSNSCLNRCTVWFDGLTSDKDIVVGFPLRDVSPVFADCGNGILAYADPTQGPDNGKAMLGVVLEASAQEHLNRYGHALLKSRMHSDEKFSYHWGFSWDRTGFNSMNDWSSYLNRSKEKFTRPITLATLHVSENF